MRKRAFSFLEMMVVVAIVGVVAGLAMIAMGPIIERARREDQTRSAMAQIRKLRAQALTANEGGAVDVDPIGGASSGVRITTATVPAGGGGPGGQCQNYLTRATRIETREYDLLDITVPRTNALLCFSAEQFQLLQDDGVSPAPIPASIDFADEGGTVFGNVDVSPLGTLAVSFEATVDGGVRVEGAAVTANPDFFPAPEDPMLHVQQAGTLEPELPVMDPPPPSPTTPVGEAPIEALPPPTPDPPPPPAPACVVNADCAAGFECIANNCEPIPAGCVNDCDCPADEECVSGSCQYGCNTCSCPTFPSCSMSCQHMECCARPGYSCLCY